VSASDKVVKLVNEWKPDICPTELKYRDSLVRFLRSKMDGATIETEYRHQGTTTDIYVKVPSLFSASETFVELKRNLLQKSQLDRLVGQLEQLRPSKNYIVVVLCGETNPALLTRLKERYCHDIFSMTTIVTKAPKA
jgi:hypothetical protein